MPKDAEEVNDVNDSDATDAFESRLKEFEKKLGKPRTTWRTLTKEQLRLVRALKARGFSYAQIANAMGVSVTILRKAREAEDTD